MTVPKLRFKEFDGDWQFHPLEDSFSKIRNGFVGIATPFYVEQGVKYLQGKNIKEGKIDPTGLIYISEDFHFQKKNSKLETNDILMVQSGHVGECAVVTKEYDNANCHALIILSPSKKTKVNSYFYSYFFESNYGKRCIYQIKTGNTIEHVLASEVKELIAPVTVYEEQTKIASFLSAVDEKISQLTQKHELLSQYKQGMMQKLFSQQIRFKADDGSEFGEWEDKIIGEIANIKRGASPRPITDAKWFDEESKVGWVRISDVSKSKKILVETEQYLSNEGIQKSRFIPKGNIIMSICATIGKPIYTGFDVCIHDGFVVFSELKAWHEYTYYYLEYIEKNWYQYGQPGTQVNLNSDIVSNEIFPFPCLEEQTKIANFLSAIDQKIEVVAQQIEQDRKSVV